MEGSATQGARGRVSLLRPSSYDPILWVMKTSIRYDRCASGDIAVYLDNRRAGTIISFEQGWTYVPAGHTVKDRGEVLPTPEAVMRTLEDES